MQIVPLHEITEAVCGGVVSIGNFDGVHRGHAALVARASAIAARVGGPVVAVVLDPHPAALLRPDRMPPKLTSLDRRAELLACAGVEFLVVVAIDREFLNLSADEFFRSLVRKKLHARGVVEGANFCFGRGREGTIETLASLCETHGLEFSIADPVYEKGEMISSTRVREALAGGDLDAALVLLGHQHRIVGRVVSGDQRGRTIGFPTANLSEIEVLVPGPGVYAGFVQFENSRELAAIHVGPNPTFDNQSADKVEVHLIDYTGDLYDLQLTVDFVHRVRDIARFESPIALVAQLKRDVQIARTALKNCPYSF